VEPFKNIYNKKSITKMSVEIQKHCGEFDDKSFLAFCLKDINSLEMKARVIKISNGLCKFMPHDYKKNIKILLKTLKNESCKSNDGLEGFILWPYTQYIETYGLDDFKTSMNALYEITKRYTSEFGIRSFFEAYPKESYKIFDIWIKDESEHVRRLVSEGTRPNLPWGKNISHLEKNLDKNIKILNRLKHDPSEYVRKSVANHMNDISRVDKNLMLKTVKEWSKIDDKNLKWIVKHSLRSLLKMGEPKALSILGYNPKAKISLSSFELSKDQIKMGESFDISFKVLNESNKSEKLMIDYTIHYKKANGLLHPKTFKLKNIELKAKETSAIKKKISFKKVTTRKLYPGEHKINIQINGKSFRAKMFNLLVDHSSSAVLKSK